MRPRAKCCGVWQGAFCEGQERYNVAAFAWMRKCTHFAIQTDHGRRHRFTHETIPWTHSILRSGEQCKASLRG